MLFSSTSYSEDKPTPSKKKKLLNKDKSSTSSSSQDHLDQAALNRRAERFSREHEIERQKSLKGGQNPSHHVSFINRIQNNSRSGSSTPYPADGPEGGERVCLIYGVSVSGNIYPFICVLRIGTSLLLLEHPKTSSRIICV